MEKEYHISSIVLSCIGILSVIHLASASGRVKQLVPNHGSFRGGTLLQIRGEGFSPNQFSFKDSTKGNQVIFINTVTRDIHGCDIVVTDTNENRILCETQAVPITNSDYEVEIKVDGALLNGGKYGTFCGGKCLFYYREQWTPSISLVEPQSGLPGDIITIHGLPQTTQISRLSMDYDYHKREISKSFLGSELCEPFDITTNELIGAWMSCGSVGCSGWFKCQPVTQTVGSWNASFIVSDNGRSVREKKAYLVDGNDEAYTFQTYADVSTVSPNIGSRMGGQTITITGKYFTNAIARTSVTVGGVRCKVISASKTEIKCITGKAPPPPADASDPYPGARGFVMDIWNGSKARSFSDFSKFNKSSPLYSRHVLRDTISFYDKKWPKMEYSHGKFTGFFVPPHTGMYTFLIKNDDVGRLYMSQSESASNKSIIASTPSYSENSYFKHASQKSTKRNLIKGQPYYFESDFFDYGGGYHAEMAVLVDNTKRTSGQVIGGYNEKQRVRINSVYLEEKQVVNVSSPSVTSFQLSYGGRISSPISSNANASTVKQELTKMFSRECTYSLPTSNGHYFQDFEGVKENNEYGTRKSSVSPFCGRQSLNIDSSWVYLYKADLSKKSGVLKKLFSLKTYSKLCFGYMGAISNSIKFNFKYQNTERETKSASRTYTFARSSKLQQWNHICLDMHKLISEDSWVKSRMSSSPNFKLNYIAVYRDGSGNEDALVDDVWIGKSFISVVALKPAARPNGILIENCDVTQRGSCCWEISMKPTKCGTNIGLIGVNGTSPSIETATKRLYQLPSSVVISVEQLQAASLPVGGTFKLSYENIVVEEIAADIPATELAAKLQRDLRSGELSVKRGGTCSGYYWDVEWIAIGGNKPQMVADRSLLTGNSVTIIVETKVDGGLLMGPIPAEFLRLPEEKPQVVVTINNIVSACMNNSCSYTYSDSWTPKITSVSPSSGHGGPPDTCTVITISGSGFSSVNAENSVTISGTVCQVSSSSASSISCCVGYSQAGTHTVRLHVKGKGYAMANVSAANFKYNLLVTSMEPKEGSIAGGTRVTIDGSGFGDKASDVKVLIGGTLCDVISVNISRIVCMTGVNTAGNKTLNITILDETTAINDAFLYSASLTPTITSVTSDLLTVTGNVLLKIQGTSLNSTSGSIPNVKIGGKPCAIVNSSSTEVYCTTPPNAPGKHRLAVIVDGKGLAQSPQLLEFVEYILSVRNVYPRHGSVIGGTILTLEGAGFVSNVSKIHISIGKRKCDVISSTKDVIKCKTKAASNVVVVDNSARHPEFGPGYAWNVTIVEINIGDSVEWQWTSNPLSKLSIGVYQALKIGTDYDGNGFYSSRGSCGKFIHRFDKPGVYHFSSGAIDRGKRIIMNGKVIVRGMKAHFGNVHLKIGGHEAIYNASESNSSIPDDCVNGIMTNFTLCDPLRSNNSSQNNSMVKIPENSHPFKFTYAPCVTPIIDSFTPRWITKDTVVIVNGKGFSSQPCQNHVKLGGHECNAISSTGTQIECRINTTTLPPVNTHMGISMHVNNRGNALVQIKSPVNETLRLRAIVSDFTPKQGSLAGGTKITIKGSGFAGKSAIVTIGLIECKITHMTYEKIECSTGKLSSSETDKSWPLNVHINSDVAVCNQSNCQFTYNRTITAMVDDIIGRQIRSSSEEIVIKGSQFGDDSSKLSVTVGPTVCNVSSVNDSHITCILYGAPAGNHKLHVYKSPSGNAWFNTSDTVQCIALVTGVTPNVGSIHGGTHISIDGIGFDPTFGRVSATVGIRQCLVKSVTYTRVVCTTPAGSKSVNIVVKSGSVTFPSAGFSYDSSVTPTINSLSVVKGRGGNSVTISGGNLARLSGSKRRRRSLSANGVTVTFGGLPCNITSSSNTSIDCQVPLHPAGTVPVRVHVDGRGNSNSNVTFEYELVLSGISPTESGFGGGRNITLTGSGFSVNDTVRICNKTCRILAGSVQNTELICESPMINLGSFSIDHVCSVHIETSSGISKSLSNAYTYRANLTSTITSVSPRRGGTGGGVRVTISGTGLQSASGASVVTIAGYPCVVQSTSANEIVCITAPSSKTIKTDVRVDVGQNGKAVPLNASFFYVDVWSSKYSWGGRDPPVAGDFVIIKKGQVMLLDIDTPVFKILLIEGGQLIFDEKDLHLQSENILIMDGGMLRIGESPEKPFQHKATVTIHGHVRSTELPVYGAKSVAVRNGSLELYGKHIMHTWTRLSETANAGARSIKLQLPVNDWNIGDEIVIASTSKSLRENEVVKITGVRDGGRTVDISPALNYTHISINQTIAGRTIETRGEVGVLTRNIVIQGSMEKTWLHTIKNCPKEFEPGQFKTQTCFDGRFGEERGSDQFGVQIIMHSGVRDSRVAKGYFHYVEVRHAGQAFRLGRYPIHFHMDGDVTGSYVKGCAIHHSFNRAVTIHGVHNLVVEDNVFYDVLGNAFFMENGIETGNIMRYNLGIFVKPSSSTLNVDITPGIYWITNANNTVSHNAAAGGTHFGFWYQMFDHPDGPSFTTSVCPRNVPMLEFRNNTAHSCGRYGLWIFPIYHPKKGGSCKATEAEPAVFHSLFAWNCMRGAEVVAGGAIQFVENVVLDNDLAGIEVHIADSGNSPWGGAMVKDSLVVGHSELRKYNKILLSTQRVCTAVGVQLPRSPRLTVSNVTFVNFDLSPGCTVFRGCGFCGTAKKGGWVSRFEKLTFVNSPRITSFELNHRAIYEDLDGTLTGYAGGTALPHNPTLPPHKCTVDQRFSIEGLPGAVCKPGVAFRRIAWNNIKPSLLNLKNAIISNRYGNTTSPWSKKSTTHKLGWMAVILLNETTTIGFEMGNQITNISYTMKVYELEKDDHLYISHKFYQEPDFFTTTGAIVNGTVGIPDPMSNAHGTWNFKLPEKRLTILAKGNPKSSPAKPIAMPVNLKVYRCFFLKCVVPTPPPAPKGRPKNAGYWSKPADWKGTLEGYGGYNGILPKDGDNVMINSDKWMVADIETPKLNRLYIYGVLELENGRNHNLSANIIFISGLNGNLIVGWPDKPMVNNVIIRLLGNHATKDMPLNKGPNVGAKALGVFARLQMFGKERTVHWTALANTVNVGENTLFVERAPDWVAGDEIVISTSTYESRQAEKFIIESINGSKIIVQGTFKFKHLGGRYLVGNHMLRMAAKVGLLTRNIVIEGADDPAGSLGDQSFGCRVLVGSYIDGGIQYRGKAQISNVQFKNCGQYGWNEDYDPRYALAYHNLGTINGNESFVQGCSFHDGYNTGVGIFSTNNLLVEDNILHHVVGAGIRVHASGTRLLRNLIILLIAPHTYKGLVPPLDLFWPGGIEVIKAKNTTMIGNVVAGSEKIGFLIPGENCEVVNREKDWRENEAHSCLHGIHIDKSRNFGDCARVSNFYSWKNFDYGIFSFASCSIIVSNSTFADSGNDLFLYVGTPRAVKHIRKDRFVKVIDSLIIGVSPSFDCSADSVRPMPATIVGARAPRASGGGMIGAIISSFISVVTPGPLKPWNLAKDYPAIGGKTSYNRTTFANFVEACGKKTPLFSTNLLSGDISHPTELQDITLINVTKSLKVLIQTPSTRWINPADCVDMDCDALRKIVIKDIDGSFFGKAGGSLVSRSEYQWDGDRRYGLGNYRIPKTMVSNLDGSRIDADVKYPHKGIVRGTKYKSFCTFKQDYGAYYCTSLDYFFLVVETMDDDTETLRRSPVALAANGYIDLINGPMDHGCCFGYTCQERISTFYTVVASQLTYELYFTSLTPYTLRLHLLNSEMKDAVVLKIYYTSPQRLDVYYKGVYVLPTNGKYQGTDFELLSKDPTKPADQYVPTLDGNPGLNYFDTTEKLLYVVMKGPEFIEIRTTSVIQLKMGVSSRGVSIDDFFKKNLVKNLAALFGIDESRIRVMDVISAGGARRRRSTGLSYIDVQIGDPPLNSTTNTNTTANQTAFSKMEDLTTKVVQSTQTGSLSSATGLNLDVVTVTEPTPPPVDPTGGVRATLDTVQIVNATNDTLRYDQKNANSQVEVKPVDYYIPKKLVIIAESSNSNETVPFPSHPKLRMYDALNRWVQNLGREKDRWKVTATIVPGTGDASARLMGESTVEFINGTANFTNLAVSHKGTGYKLKFEVTYPLNLSFVAESAAFEIKERVLVFKLLQEPTEANETVPFAVQPKVEVRDAANGELVNNTGWKGRKWLFTATLVQNGNSGSGLMGTTSVEFEGAFAQFTNLSIDSPGKGYQLTLNTLTSPSSTYSATFTTAAFDVKERELYLRIAQQPGDCNDTVICGNQPILEIRSKYPDALAGNIGWKGSSWYINASMHSGASNAVLNGTTYFKIPSSGLIRFTDLNFYDVAVGYKLKFNVIIVPYNPRFANMSLVSDSFDVKQRQFFLAVKESPKDANDSVVFGTQPVIEVRDVGTNVAAKPLKRHWNITASIDNNAAGNGSLKGTVNSVVMGEVATFTDLLIVGYGVGYTLKFKSNYGHTVITSPFNVRFRNDYRPVFNPSSPSIIAVYENITTPVILRTFVATDNDTGIAGTVKYALSDSSLDWLFGLSPTTGSLTLKAGLDRENVSSYTMSIQASDSAPSPFFFTTSHALRVNVLDVNDNKPNYPWPVLNITVPETVKSGEVAFNVSTTDADAGENGRITYTIQSSNASGKFQLNENTGVFTALVSHDLDGNEQQEPLYHFIMKVHDNGMEFQQSVEINVFVRVVRINEFSPTFSPSTVAVSKLEDIPIGSVITTLNATDADSGQDGNITYTITSGNVNGVFGINAGNVILQSKLDRETLSSYNLVITASDNPINGVPKSSTLIVVLNVMDVNDNRPMFSQASYTLDVPDNAAVGTAAVSVTAVDGDAGLNGQLEYRVTSGSSPLFKLDKSTGSFIPLSSLDLDSQSLTSKSYHMTVFVTDKGQPFALNNSVNVTLRIVAVNEYVPVLSHSADMMMLLSSSKQIGNWIFKINATDKDFGSDGKLTYSIADGNFKSVFSLNSTTGDLYLANIRTDQFYSLEMTVTDHGTNPGPKSTNVRLVLFNERSSSGTGAGSVYVGSSRASVPMSFTSGQTTKVPVYANVAFQDLEGIDVTISYDKGIVRYDSATTDVIAVPGSGTIRLIGLVKPDSKLNGIPKIAELTFTGLLSTSVNMAPSGVVMADKAGKSIPMKAKGPSCAAVLLGDVSNDCKVDITDAALIQTYVREMQTNFASVIGQAISTDLTTNQKNRMDVDQSGIVDYYDAQFLQNALVGYTKFISSFSVLPPTVPSCDLKVTAELKNIDQAAATNTRAFAVFTYTDSTLNAEFTSSGMAGSTSFTLKSGLNRYGRVFEMQKSSNGSFSLTSVKPKLSKNDVGVSLVIVATSASVGSKVSSSFVKPANITGSKSTVTITSGISIDIYDSFGPQKRVNFSSSYQLCNGKTVSKHLRLIFDSDFSLVRGKEAKFIADFKSFFEAKYRTSTREVVASNITVKAGSIIVEFDVTVIQSQETQFISDVTNDVKNGLTFKFESNSMTAAQTLTVDGKEKIPTPKAAESDNKILIIIIVVVVVFCLLFAAIVIFICYRKKHMGSKRIDSVTKRYNRNSKVHMKKDFEMSPLYGYEIHSSHDEHREFVEVIFTDSPHSEKEAEIEIKDTALDNPCYESYNDLSDGHKAPLFADSPVPAGSRPSTVDSRLKKRQNGDIGFRPKSAGPRFGTSELVIERIGPTKENHYESSLSKEALAIPEHRHESDILEMHPNVPTPEVGYYDDLNHEMPVYKTLEIKQLRDDGMKVLHHVCEVEVNVNGTLEELRTTIRKHTFLNKQKMLFLTSKLKGVNPNKEVDVKVKEIFKNDIRIKVLHGTDGYSLFCPCGEVAKMHCQVCTTRGYCSIQCEAEDSIDHKKVCSKGNKIQRQRDGSKRMSKTSTAAPPHDMRRHLKDIMDI